jgi:hypothetical protein
MILLYSKASPLELRECYCSQIFKHTIQLEKKLDAMSGIFHQPKTPDKLNPKSLPRIEDAADSTASLSDLDPCDKKFQR